MSLFYKDGENYNDLKVVNVWVAMITAFVVLLVIIMAVLPSYRIYAQDRKGQANLRQQEWEKQILVEQAKAQKESAILLAGAEVERAKGVAEANSIISDGLGGAQGYLRYLYINQLSETENQIIYVPTEAGLPILEATRK